jgi:hypothetical protein
VRQNLEFDFFVVFFAAGQAGKGATGRGGDSVSNIRAELIASVEKPASSMF